MKKGGKDHSSGNRKVGLPPDINDDILTSTSFWKLQVSEHDIPHTKVLLKIFSVQEEKEGICYYSRLELSCESCEIPSTKKTKRETLQQTQLLSTVNTQVVFDSLR